MLYEKKSCLARHGYSSLIKEHKAIAMKFVITFLVLWLSFGILEWLFPLRKEQKHFRQGWMTDVAHFFFNHILVNIGTYLIIDLLFGTYYVPRSQMPETYGVTEIVPQSYWQQLLYPFQKH